MPWRWPIYGSQFWRLHSLHGPSPEEGEHQLQWTKRIQSNWRRYQCVCWLVCSECILVWQMREWKNNEQIESEIVMMSYATLCSRIRSTRRDHLKPRQTQLILFLKWGKKTKEFYLQTNQPKWLYIPQMFLMTRSVHEYQFHAATCSAIQDMWL